MNLAESFRFAWRGITTNKARSALTMLGVLIGVASVIALVAVGTGAKATVTNTLNGIGTNVLTIVPSDPDSNADPATRGPFAPPTSSGDASTSVAGSGTKTRTPRLTLDDARALADRQQAPDVLGVAPLVTANGVAATYQGRSHTVGTTTGTTTAYLAINNDTVAAGLPFGDSDYLAHSRVAVLGVTVAKDLVGGDGSALIGRNIGLNGNQFTVIGLLTAKGSVGPQDQDDRLLVPATALQDTLAGYANLSAISVKATSAETVDAAQAEVGRILDARHGTTEATRDFTVTSSAFFLDAANQVTSTFTLLLGAIAGISLLVGGIGVMNIMLVTVTERTREIGIRKAIGAGKAAILSQFLIEAVMLSMLGGLLGIGLGSLVGLVTVGSFSPVVSLPSIVVAFCFAVVVGLVFGIYPANRAASLKPIDALRYE